MILFLFLFFVQTAFANPSVEQLFSNFAGESLGFGEPIDGVSNAFPGLEPIDLGNDVKVALTRLVVAGPIFEGWALIGGIMFNITFEKTEDGSVSVLGAMAGEMLELLDGVTLTSIEVTYQSEQIDNVTKSTWTGVVGLEVFSNESEESTKVEGTFTYDGNIAIKAEMTDNSFDFSWDGVSLGTLTKLSLDFQKSFVYNTTAVNETTHAPEKAYAVSIEGEVELDANITLALAMGANTDGEWSVSFSLASEEAVHFRESLYLTQLALGWDSATHTFEGEAEIAFRWEDNEVTFMGSVSYAECGIELTLSSKFDLPFEIGGTSLSITGLGLEANQTCEPEMVYNNGTVVENINKTVAKWSGAINGAMTIGDLDLSTRFAMKEEGWDIRAMLKNDSGIQLMEGLWFKSLLLSWNNIDKEFIGQGEVDFQIGDTEKATLTGEFTINGEGMSFEGTSESNWEFELAGQDFSLTGISMKISNLPENETAAANSTGAWHGELSGTLAYGNYDLTMVFKIGADGVVVSGTYAASDRKEELNQGPNLVSLDAEFDFNESTIKGKLVVDVRVYDRKVTFIGTVSNWNWTAYSPNILALKGKSLSNYRRALESEESIQLTNLRFSGGQGSTSIGADLVLNGYEFGMLLEFQADQ